MKFWFIKDMKDGSVFVCWNMNFQVARFEFPQPAMTMAIYTDQFTAEEALNEVRQALNNIAHSNYDHIQLVEVDGK